MSLKQKAGIWLFCLGTNSRRGLSCGVCFYGASAPRLLSNGWGFWRREINKLGQVSCRQVPHLVQPGILGKRPANGTQDCWVYRGLRGLIPWLGACRTSFWGSKMKKGNCYSPFLSKKRSFKVGGAEVNLSPGLPESKETDRVPSVLLLGLVFCRPVWGAKAECGSDVSHLINFHCWLDGMPCFPLLFMYIPLEAAH